MNKLIIILITKYIITIRQFSSTMASPGLQPWLSHSFWSFCLLFPENNYSLVLDIKVDQFIWTNIKLWNSCGKSLGFLFSFKPSSLLFQRTIPHPNYKLDLKLCSDSDVTLAYESVITVINGASSWNTITGGCLAFMSPLQHLHISFTCSFST